VRAFLLWGLGTGARPEAVLDLHASQIDLEAALIVLNPPGQRQTKKHRPTVKLPNTLRAHISEGYQVTFRGKRCNDIKTAWRNHRRACGLDARIVPYCLRHTAARHLRASGVPAWEVSAQLGHKRKELSITEIYAPFDPSYLNNAVQAIDQFLQQLLVSVEEVPLVSCTSRVHGRNGENGQGLDFFGAGEALRQQISAASADPAPPPAP
jgi:integrase